MIKPTVIIGASPKTDRYSFKATVKLVLYGHTVYPIGIKEGMIDSIPIITNKPILDNVHTVTLYINPTLQQNWLDYIISLKPKRVIFNPGTENPNIYSLLNTHNIDCVEACTLVLLSLNSY
jgi:predicted CoA-binding protein